MTRSGCRAVAFLVLLLGVTLSAQMPQTPLVFGAFTVRFNADGTFKLTSEDWPTFEGTWKVEENVLELTAAPGSKDCTGLGQYRITRDAARMRFDLASDECKMRALILDRSTWRPEGETEPVPERRIQRTAAERTPTLPRPAASREAWPSFRGPGASGVADGQRLPDRWDVKTGENISWRTKIPGLGHSSPVVWGDRVFVTSAVSSRPDATFKPGLYGDGWASDDLSHHRWIVQAIDKRTGKLLWERVAHEGVPREKRHIKSTYASSSPATDGRIVVAWFGSHGVHAFDVNGNFLWKVDLGRIDLGAYDVPTYEWGTASSPIIWNDLVILQCDTQADSFVLALKAETGEVVWKTERDELPSWGTPTVVSGTSGPELVTNASNFIRGYDPRTGKELWRLGGSSKITAPTPTFTDGLVLVASGRRPERPLFAVRPGARGDLTLAEGQTKSDAIAWSHSGRGSYMPTPLIYKGIVYVLANNGVFDAYDLQTGKEIYRQRLAHLGSGFSASPIAADDRIYLTNEDGEITVLAAGPEFKHLATNAMGEPLMATPALSEGVMYVRGSSTLFAIGGGKPEI